MQQIPSLLNICDDFDNYIIDVWGVVHNGLNLFDGVSETLEALKEKGKFVMFLSNAPRRAYHVKSDLTHLGLDPSLYIDVHTSGEDVYEHLVLHQDTPYGPIGRKGYLLSSANHDHLIDDCGLERVGTLEEADFLFNTGPDQRSLEHADYYKKLFQKAHALNLLMICVNPDISVIHGGQELLCAGSFAKAYQEMGGRVSYHGKPFPSVYESVIKKFPNPSKSKTLAIGDGLLTDIQGANLFGLKSALVLSGLARDHHLEKDLTPNTTPTYVMPGL